MDISGLIQIGNDFLQSSFSILENQPMDMLLGLDMLKRHQVNKVYIASWERAVILFTFLRVLEMFISKVSSLHLSK